MLASITPLGERSRHSRFAVTLTAYTVGCTVGGGTLGLLLGGLGQAAHTAGTPHRLYFWAAAAVLGALADLRLARLHIPTHRRQVPKHWLYTYRGWVYGAGFGLQLGAGFATIVNSSLIYLMALAAFLGGSLKAGLIIGLAFGVARAAALLPAIRVRTPPQLMRMTKLLTDLDDRTRRVAAGAAMALAIAVVFVDVY